MQKVEKIGIEDKRCDDDCLFSMYKHTHKIEINRVVLSEPNSIDFSPCCINCVMRPEIVNLSIPLICSDTEQKVEFAICNNHFNSGKRKILFNEFKLS